MGMYMINIINEDDLEDGEDSFHYQGPSIIDIAARRGLLNAVKWLRTQRTPCEWGSDMCSHAASGGGGQLAVLKWLRSRDPPCEWDENTSIAAAGMAGRGHIEVLKWLIMSGHIEVLKWLKEQDPPCRGADEYDSEGKLIDEFDYYYEFDY